MLQPRVARSRPRTSNVNPHFGFAAPPPHLRRRPPAPRRPLLLLVQVVGGGGHSRSRRRPLPFIFSFSVLRHACHHPTAPPSAAAVRGAGAAPPPPPCAESSSLSSSIALRSSCLRQRAESASTVLVRARAAAPTRELAAVWRLRATTRTRTRSTRARPPPPAAIASAPSAPHGAHPSLCSPRRSLRAGRRVFSLR